MVLELIGIVAVLGIGYFVRTQLVGRLDRQRTFVLELDDTLLELRNQVDKLQLDIDQLMSDGPQPVSVVATPTVKVPPVIDNVNVAVLESDTLPLHGHTIVVGQSGGGKSNVAMSQCIRRLSDGQQLYCIDTKSELGPIFRKHMTEVVKAEQGEELIRKLLKIAADRQLLFETTSEDHERPIRDYNEYAKVTGTKLPIITLVVEELIVLMPLIGQDLLIALLVMGRSAGVFVLAMAQYLKADVLDRKGSVNFNTSVFIGKYDRISATILFGNLERDEAQLVKEFVGAPGKAAVSENGVLRTQVMPRVYDYHLAPYMQKERK